MSISLMMMLVLILASISPAPDSASQGNLVKDLSQGELRFTTYYRAYMQQSVDSDEWVPVRFATQTKMVEWRIDIAEGRVYIGHVSEDAGATRVIVFSNLIRKTESRYDSSRSAVEYALEFPTDVFIWLTEYMCDTEVCGYKVVVETEDDTLMRFVEKGGLEVFTSYNISGARWPFDLFRHVDRSRD